MTAFFFLVLFNSLGDRKQGKLRGRERLLRTVVNYIHKGTYSNREISYKYILLLLSFIREMHSYELFTFRDVCEKASFIRNIFIKQYIHEENIFMRTHLVFLCHAPPLLLLED